MNFTPSLAFDVKIACQNYFQTVPVLRYCAANNHYKKEAWHETMLRIVSWFTVAMPLVIGFTLCVSHYLAHQAIQERRDYWSGQGPDGTDLIRQARRAWLKDSQLREPLIYALQNSDVPKTPFENIFLHPCGLSKSALSFGNDTYFDEDETPSPTQKTLHIFHQFIHADNAKGYSFLQEWDFLRMREEDLQKLVDRNRYPKTGIKNLHRLEHGMVYTKVNALSQWPFGKLPDSLKILLASGQIDADYEQAFKQERNYRIG